MLFLLLLAVTLSTISTVSGACDQQCVDNCSCCKDGNCGPGINKWPNVCSIGCIDGHRGARCYELCQYENCKSCGGNTNSKDCTECYDGYYLGTNKDCTSQCPSNCKSCTSSAMCTECKEGFYNKDGSTTCPFAECPTNCECNYQGDCVSCKAGYYHTFTSCTKTCSVNCVTCESENECNECRIGFYNNPRYNTGVNPRLNICLNKCRDACVRCQSEDKCSECVKGKYDNICQTNCSVGCKDRTCLINSGKCQCAINFTGEQCMKCVARKYGAFCDKTCSKYCKGNTCKRESGHCNDCINEYLTGDTCETCKLGMYGEYCEEACSRKCPNNKCERSSGYCSEPCSGNFTGPFCDKCKSGKYGVKCTMDCPINCAGGKCLQDSGFCETCVGNFYGKTCNECNVGYYNTQCNAKCSQFCYNNTCQRNTGLCTFGCKSGYSGDKCCVNTKNCIECFNNTSCIKCESGFYKESCNKKCPEGCLGSCDISTGACEHCPNLRFGQFCTLSCSDRCKKEGVDNRACAKSDGRCYGCHDGFFGHTCNSKCSSSCVDKICRQDDGVCINGCENFQKQPECILSEESQQQKDGSNSGLIATATVLGTMFTLSFAANIVLLALFLLKKIKVSRRKQCRTEMEPTYENQLKSVSKQSREAIRDDAVHSETVEGNVYDGISSVNEKEHQYQQLSHIHDSML